jgi:TATA-box binding protein (TBP) (component of TFIID and TFIIIB)
MNQNKENILVSDRLGKPLSLNASDVRFALVKWDTKQFKVSIQSLNDFGSHSR